MERTLATSDNRGRPNSRGDARFRPAWGFKGDAVERILDMIRDEPHPWIHACCGGAVIPGEDRRVDLYHPSGENIDIQDLDLHVQGAGAIVVDPPYGETAWPLDVRQRAMSACWRALRPGGLLVVHSPWQPRFAQEWAQMEDPILVREDNRLDWPAPPVMLCAYRKTKDPAMSGPARNGPRVQKRARKRIGGGAP